MGASHSSRSPTSTPYRVRARPSIRTSYASSSLASAHSRNGSTSSSPSSSYEMSSRSPSSQGTFSQAPASPSPPIRIGYPYYEDIALEAELAKQKSREKGRRRRKLRESFGGGSR